MTEKVFRKIKNLLDLNNIQYEVLEHDIVHTSADAAKVRDTDISMGAKALVMYADKLPLLFVVPADLKASFKLIKESLKIKNLRMASVDEVLKLTGLVVGSIPPFGSCIGLTSYFDAKFLTKETVVFNAGMLTRSISMKASDLLKAENPKIVKITE